MWKSQQESRPRRPTTSSYSRYIYSSSSSSTTITSSGTSPPTLMSSLQQREPTVRIKDCSIEVEEIIMDRRDAIMSGRFKGRQLFAAEQSSPTRSYGGGGGEMCSDWVKGISGREVAASYEMSSDFGRSCSLLEAKAVVGMAEKRGGWREAGGEGWWVATAKLGAVLIVLALLLCSLCSGNNFEELSLVPT